MNFSLSRELLRSASKIALAAAAASFLSGCGGTGAATFSGQDGASAVSTLNGTEPDSQDFVGGAAFWGSKYEANRSDMTAAVNFSRNLRMMGGAKQAVAVMKDVVMKAPDDAAVLAEYGKSLTAAGRVQDALPFLSRATQIEGDDWTTFSAYGVALDQTGNHKAALNQYQTALKLSPANPTVESNIAMSHVIQGNIDQAELILRRLVARPDATPQMRQNLAMVTAIKGNATEAEQLAREDLVPSDATNNLALLQQFDARNVAINVEPLAPPVQTPSVAPEKASPAALAPIGENAGTNSAALNAQQPPTAANITTPAVAPTRSPAPPKASPYTMAPIADTDEIDPAQNAAPKPLVAPNNPPPVAATPKAASLATPTSEQPQAVKPLASIAPAEAPTSEPTPVLRQSFDVYRRSSRVEVANAAQ